MKVIWLIFCICVITETTMVWVMSMSMIHVWWTDADDARLMSRDQSPYLCVCHSTTPLPTWTEFICKLKAVKVIMPAFGTCQDLAQVLGVIAGNHVVACFYHKSQSFCRSEVHANTHAVLGSPSPRNCNCRLQTAGKKLQVPDCNINEFKAAMMARAMMSTLNSVSVQGNIVNWITCHSVTWK